MIDISNKHVPTFKCVIFGDGGVGKTTFVNRLNTGKFVNEYNPTIGLEVHPLTFNYQSQHSPNENGYVVFNCWEYAGKQKYQHDENLEGCLVDVDCAIIMCDNYYESLHNVGMWLDKIKHLDIPKIIVRTKYDEPQRRFIKYNLNKYVKNIKTKCIDISTKSKHNIDEPFILLSEMLLHTKIDYFI